MGQYPSVDSQPENGKDELFRKKDAEKLLILIDARRAEDQLATNKYIEEVATTNFYNQVLLVALGTTAYYGMKKLRQYFNIKVFQQESEKVTPRHLVLKSLDFYVVFVGLAQILVNTINTSRSLFFPHLVYSPI